MEMPIFQPVGIQTRYLLPWERIWRWITFSRKWMIAKDWVFDLPGRNLKIVIPKGFVFDGASIPKPVWGVWLTMLLTWWAPTLATFIVIGLLITILVLMSPVGFILLAGLVHDFGYRYDYLWTRNDRGQYVKCLEGIGQKGWDRILYEVGTHVNGMIVPNALPWLALTFAGRFAWKSNRKRGATGIRPGG